MAASLLASRRCTFGAVRSRSLQTVRPRVAAPVRGRRLLIAAAADKAAVETDVIAIIKEQLGTEDAITAESKFVDLGADSLDTVEIMMALEEKFDIELDEEGAEKISTVGQAVDVIVAQVNSK